MNYWDRFMTSAQGYSTQWLGNEWGPPAFSVARALIMIVMVLAPVILTVLYYQLIERWVIGWIQVRKGPNRVGWKGVLQPIAGMTMAEQEVICECFCECQADYDAGKISGPGCCSACLEAKLEKKNIPNLKTEQSYFVPKDLTDYPAATVQ